MNSARLPLAASLSLLLAACGVASGSSNTSTAQAATANAVTQTAVTTTSVTTNAKLGINLGYFQYWGGTRPFMNLIYGSNWQMADSAGHWSDVPATDLDSNGWIKSLPAGYQAARNLSVPQAGGDFICRYQGNAIVHPNGPVSNVTQGAGYVRFTIAPATYPNAQWVVLAYAVDPTNYLRNLDCREASASTTDEFAPEFLSLLKGFQDIRFVKWTPSVEANTPNITWATRNKPGDGDFSNNDGVPIELMVDLANKAGSDPWFTIPWNANDDYITRMATYVRDNMAPGHKAYIEVSNEVWNFGYPVATQATQEALAEGLVSAEDPTKPGGNGERYAEKVKQVMAIWSSVFSGQTNRMVRVFAWQHVQPYWSDKLLGYMNTSNSVDALATAPYFGYNYTGTETLDQIFSTLPAQITDAMNYAVQQKANAQKYNVRYVTYEGGEAVDFSNTALLTQVQEDPRMGPIYSTYLSGWQNQIGDLLTLFSLSGGNWGLVYYAGQPVSQTPKMNAVQQFLGLNTTAATSTGGTTTTSSGGSSTPVISSPTQICPDGSIISATSTCPTTTSPGGSGSKKGAAGNKGGGKTAAA